MYNLLSVGVNEHRCTKQVHILYKRTCSILQRWNALNSLNAKCIYTYMRELSASPFMQWCGYVVFIEITLNTIVDAWKCNTDMHVTP